VVAGRICELPEYYFQHRLHPKSTGSMLHFARPLAELRQVDPSVDWSLQLSRPQRSAMLRFRNYFNTVSRAPIGARERALCYAQLGRLLVEKAATRIGRSYAGR
jgi:hypothetical protein